MASIAAPAPDFCQKILREEWEFQCFVLSDGGALEDLHNGHGLTHDAAESAALALRNGCDLCLGPTYRHLPEAVERGLVSELEIDEALRRVIGPNAASIDALLGNYHGVNRRLVTALEGIVGAVSPATKVLYEPGCDPKTDNLAGIEWAATKAASSDAIIAVLGLNARIEGEEFDAPLSDAVGDRHDLELPHCQQVLLEALVKTGKPLVLVLVTCGPLSFNGSLEKVAAIVQMGYPGEEGGTALADVLFGDVNPAGRLPVTWPRSVTQLPPLEDYSTAGRTYRYMEEKPLFSFGHGLSYTEFRYAHLCLRSSVVHPGEDLELSAEITNIGSRDGDEVVQGYFSHLGKGFAAPKRQLVCFKKIHLRAGESRMLKLPVPAMEMEIFNEQGIRSFVAGEALLTVGGSQGDALSQRLMRREVLTAHLTMRGDSAAPPAHGETTRESVPLRAESLLRPTATNGDLRRSSQTSRPSTPPL